MTTIKQRLWTVEEYHRMVDTGILAPDERVELLEGQIVLMDAKKPLLSAITQWTADYLKTLLAGVADIRIHEPIHLNFCSEPEPDIAVVQLDSRNYFDYHPRPEEVFLVIEVADSTLKFDCKNKAALYAKAGIADYWVVDVSQQQVFVFRDPGTKTYQQEAIWDKNVVLTLVAFSNIPIVIERFFPSGLQYLHGKTVP